MIKEQEEKEDNQVEFEKLYGQPIVYGQAIQLRHVYSRCLLMLKSEELARQNGCVGVRSFFSFLCFSSLFYCLYSCFIILIIYIKKYIILYYIIIYLKETRKLKDEPIEIWLNIIS